MQEDSIFVEKKDGSLDIFPASAVAEETVDAAYLKVVTNGGTEFLYPLAELKSYDHQMQLNRPTITSFKFNNKFNHQLFSDVLCEITDDNQINGTTQVSAFTHWLTPSFKRSDARAEVYLNDKELLYSKVSRVKIGDKERVTIAYPGIRILKNALVSPAEEGMPSVYADTLVPYGTEYQLNLDWAQATGVPKVYINISGGGLVSSKDYYLDATIRIDGAGIYPDFAETAVQIKGRGNSSWSSTPKSKNPYRLKFEKKKQPFGLNKGKSWVLLANRQSGSMTSNAIGMYAAGLIGADGANHIIPVELYMNGEYWGSYNFTEKTGLANNSIDLDDETKACLLELDTYNDETRYWSYANIGGQHISIPVKIKEPDVFKDAEHQNDESVITLITSPQDIMTRFNEFVQMVENGEDISSVVDIESLARFLVTNELIINYELMHPKSTFLYHEDIFDPETKFKWGPVWDLDWGFGYEYGSHTYFLGGATNNYFTRSQMEATAFWKQLRKCGEPLDRAMYKYWSRFIRLYLDELIDYCDDYYAFARPSLEHNNSHVFNSDIDNTNYAATTRNSKRWLQQRATAILKQLTPYDLTEEEIMGIPATPEELPNDNPYFTDGISAPSAPTTLFDVYDLRGIRLKQRATYDTWRNGLAPGIYIVNGKKVLVK